MSVPGDGVPGQSGHPTGPKVRLELIGEAWRLVQQQMGTWVLSMLVVAVAAVAVMVVMSTLMFGAALGLDGGPSFFTFHPGQFLLNGVFSAVMMAALAVLSGGLYRMAIKQARGEPIQVADLFTVSDVLGPLVVTSILYGVVVGIGYALCVIPGLIAAGLLLLAVPLAVDRHAFGMDALKMSYEALKPEAVMAVVFAIVTGLVVQVGVMLCGIGVLVTGPIALVSVGLLYRDVFDAPPTVPPAPPTV